MSRSVVASLAVCLAGASLSSCAIVQSQVFPGAELAHKAAAAPAGWTMRTITTDDGSVEAWLHIGAGRSSTSPGPAVLFAHGNGELVDDWWAVLDAVYVEHGITALLVEYRGYGRSGGEPNEERLVADAASGFDMLAAEPAVVKTRIIVHGQSIGSGVACALSRARPVGGLIVHSGFASFSGFLWEKFSVPWFIVPDRFDNEGAVRDGHFPVLIVHGARDQLIDVDNARRLAAAAGPRGTLRLYPHGHDDCFDDAIAADLVNFVQAIP